MNWTAIISNPVTDTISIQEFFGPHGTSEAEIAFKERFETSTSVLCVLIPGSHSRGSLVIQKPLESEKS